MGITQILGQFSVTGGMRLRNVDEQRGRGGDFVHKTFFRSVISDTMINFLLKTSYVTL